MTRKLLFVLADGGRARFVERMRDRGDFVTVDQIDHSGELRTLRAELRASPPARTFPGRAPRRSAVGRDDYIRSTKQAFMAEVADRAAALVAQHALEGVVVAAPPQLISPLRTKIDALTKVAGAISKDLTKTPDHELGGWLTDAFRRAQSPP